MSWAAVAVGMGQILNEPSVFAKTALLPRLPELLRLSKPGSLGGDGSVRSGDSEELPIIPPSLLLFLTLSFPLVSALDVGLSA